MSALENRDPQVEDQRHLFESLISVVVKSFLSVAQQQAELETTARERKESLDVVTLSAAKNDAIDELESAIRGFNQWFPNCPGFTNTFGSLVEFADSLPNLGAQRGQITEVGPEGSLADVD